MSVKRTAQFTLGLGANVNDMIDFGRKLAPSVLTTFKELPLIGWAFFTISEGIEAISTIRQQNISAPQKAARIAWSAVKIGLGTIAMLLPVFLAGAALSVIAPIATLTLAVIGAHGAIKKATKAWRVMRKRPSAENKHSFKLALGSAVLAGLAPIVLSFLFFMPGAQTAAMAILMSLIGVGALLKTYTLGREEALEKKQRSVEESASAAPTVRKEKSFTPRFKGSAVQQSVLGIEAPGPSLRRRYSI